MNPMAADFTAVFGALRPVLAKHEEHMIVKYDTPEGYSLDSKVPSVFPQHKGRPLVFGAIRMGKGYVSFHLMPVYMCADLEAKITPALKRRMRGKSCFNFRTVPDAGLLSDLEGLTDASVAAWQQRKWL